MRPFDIEEGGLLAGERGLRQVFRGGGGADGHQAGAHCGAVDGRDDRLAAVDEVAHQAAAEHGAAGIADDEVPLLLPPERGRPPVAVALPWAVGLLDGVTLPAKPEGCGLGAMQRDGDGFRRAPHALDEARLGGGFVGVFGGRGGEGLGAEGFPRGGCFRPGAGDCGFAARGRGGDTVKQVFGVALGILTADCAPVLLADREALSGRTPTLDISALLAERAVKVVSFADYQKIDAAEKARGAERGKVRDKLERVPDMLAAAFPKA